MNLFNITAGADKVAVGSAGRRVPVGIGRAVGVVSANSVADDPGDGDWMATGGVVPQPDMTMRANPAMLVNRVSLISI